MTALDLSPWAMQAAEAMEFPDDSLGCYLDPSARREGGSIQFVAGDLLDEDVCPGPFDVIIERRTVQIFPEELRGLALERLASRMADTGIFFSHFHNGGWRPGDPLSHVALGWFNRHGWTLEQGEGLDNLEGRVAWLMITTG